MDLIPPKLPSGFSVNANPVRKRIEAIPKDWPHAPVHRMSENGIYIVTASTLHHQLLFKEPSKKDLLERLLLSQAKSHRWDLEAWAVFANHYHFVARGNPDSTNLGIFLKRLHSLSAQALNEVDRTSDRKVWFNFWETRLTFQHSYMARLRYVHQNAVRHGLVAVGNQYPWCSSILGVRVSLVFGSLV
jgi:putative transposase